MTPRLTTPPFSLRRSASKPKGRFSWEFLGKSQAWLGVGCAIASLAAHGVLLALVIPDSNPAPPKAEDLAETPPRLDDVPLTVLPPTVKAPPAVAPVGPAPTTPVAVSPVAPQASIAPPVVAVQPQPSPQPAAEPPDTTATPPLEPVPEPPAPPSPYANFPHLEGAQAACEGVADCWRSPVVSSWRSAAGDLQARLESQGYTVNNITGEVLSIDSGVRVYAVSKPGEPEYYLNLVSVREGVLYTMTAAPMTSEQVLALQRS